jgi:hypothetical protein
MKDPEHGIGISNAVHFQSIQGKPPDPELGLCNDDDIEKNHSS